MRMRALVLGWLWLVGCSAIVDAPNATYASPDAGAAEDGGSDTSAAGEGRDGDAAVGDGVVGTLPTRLARSVLVPTSGGGNASSPRFRAVLVVGGPVGRGVASDDHHTLRLGTPPLPAVP